MSILMLVIMNTVWPQWKLLVDFSEFKIASVFVP